MIQYISNEVIMADKKNEFINKEYVNHSERSFETVIDFWNTVSKFELEMGKPLTEYTKEEYIEFFEKFDIGSLGTFHSIKTKIKKYLMFCQVPKKQLTQLTSLRYQDLDLEGMFQTLYFNSFQDLKTKIDMHYQLCPPILNQYSTAIAAMFLLWYGISVEEMTELNKTAIHDGGIEFNGEFTLVDPYCYSYLQEYLTDGSDLASNFVSSPYVIRSNIYDQLNYWAIKAAIYRFYAANPNPIVKFKPEKILESGIFWRAYQYELLHGRIERSDLETWAKVFKYNGSNIRNVAKIRNNYYRYVNHVYGELYNYKYGQI